jgi:endogenous inhibitor of DNA gyrase (YacG/DUF329 family)
LKRSKCPICRQSFVAVEGPESFIPFCSRRCKDADLARWFSEDYSVPVETERPLREAGLDLERDGGEGE